MADRIVYVVYEHAGGIDGMDPKTYPGGPRYASFDKADAEANVTPWDYMKSSVVDIEAHRAKVIARLDPIDCLALDIPQQRNMKHKKNKV